jgi:4-amino-4-deoxy-L-arabinose transferase-like glycosyltransferase
MLTGRRRLEVAAVVALFAGGIAVRLAMLDHYVFAGSDSYGYVHLADEWHAHGRYALGPAPAPLHFARPPLYPAFIALVKGDARAEMSGGEGWTRIVYAQLVVDVLVTGLLVWLMARRIGGRLAGALALALAMFVPFTFIPVGAALTECLAMALTTAAVAPLILWRRRPYAAFATAGALVALSTLLRPDGLLAGLALAPAALLLPDWRTRIIASACAVAAFAVLFAPWPLRNLERFDRAWAFGSRVDRHQQPVLYWQGPHHFMQSYGRDWMAFNEGAKCMFDRGCSLGLLESEGAVTTPAERAQLQSLLVQHSRDGLTPDVSAGYEALARANFSAHPLRTRLWLPLRRAFIMWTDAYDEMFQKPPLPRLYARTARALPNVMMAVALALALGAVGLLWSRPARPDAAILLTAIFGRTAVLAYTFYCMTRYVREVMPLGYVVTAAGLVLAARALAARRPVTA